MKRHASLNKAFRTVWNHLRQCYMVVSEACRGQRKVNGRNASSIAAGDVSGPAFRLSRMSLAVMVALAATTGQVFAAGACVEGGSDQSNGLGVGEICTVTSSSAGIGLGLAGLVSMAAGSSLTINSIITTIGGSPLANEGIFIPGTIDNATILNNMAISAGYLGIELFADMTGNSTLTNAGTITVNDDYNYSVRGILAHDLQNTATITNSGTITVENDTGETATGIEAIYLYDSAKIVNTNTITVTAVGAGGAVGYGDGVGINVNGGMYQQSEILNQGTISVTGTMNAYGIYVREMADQSTITNADSISVTLDNATPYNNGVTGSYGAGIYLETGGSGKIINSGAITVDVNRSNSIAGYSETNAYAHGILVGEIDGASSEIKNTANGTITVTADSSVVTADDTAQIEAHAKAAGMYAVGLFESATMTNAGTINATATASATGGDENDWYATAIGMGAESMYDNANITNTATGTISVESNHKGYGIYVGVMDEDTSGDATIVNEGEITVGAGRAYGIYVQELLANSTITNSGTISVDGVFLSYGIKVDAGSATSLITNSGTVNATIGDVADKSAFAIHSQSTDVMVENTATGVLSGNLNIAGTLNNAGTISLPHNANDDQVGVSAVVGTFVNSGTLKIGLLTDGTTTTHSQLLATDATFNAGSAIHVNVLAASTNAGLLVGQTLNDVVKASTSLAINATPTVDDNSALLAFEYVQDGLTIDLNILEDSSILDSTIAGGGNSNSQSAASALMAIQDNGGFSAMDSVIASLNGLATDAEVADAVESFTPMATMAAFGASTQIANTVQGIVEMRQNVNMTGGMSSGDTLFADRNFWIKPYGTWGNQDDKNGLNGFDLRTRGIGAGLDGEFSPNQNVGLAFFYTNADIDVNHMTQKADVDAYSLLVYGNLRVFDDKTNFLYQAGYTRQNTDTSRFIGLTGQTAKADYTSRVASLDLKMMRDYQVSDKLLLQPMVTATYRHFSMPSYREDGAGALDQSVNDFSSSETIVGVGAMAHYAFNEKSKLIFNASLGYDLNGVVESVSSTFAGAPGVSYDTKGIDNGRSRHEVRLAYEGRLTEQSKLNLMVTHQGQGSSFKSDSISATYMLEF